MILGIANFYRYVIWLADPNEPGGDLRHMLISQEYAKFIAKFEDAPDRFEVTIREVYSALLTAGSVALDLGAHTGKHTIPMADAVGKNGCVLAFEPIPEKFQVLLQKLNAGAFSQVSAFNVCCSHSNGIVDFVYMPTDPGKSAIHVRKSHESEQFEKVIRPCLSVRLDDFLNDAKKLDFIKMDIEGAEHAALMGASQSIARTRPIIHMEIGTPSLEAFGTKPDAIFDLLSRAEYELMDVFGIELTTKEQYLESISARGAYDYFAVPAGDRRKSLVQEVSSAMWRTQ